MKKKYVKAISSILVLALFMAMAVGSGSSSGEKKDIAAGNENIATDESDEETTAGTEEVATVQMATIEEQVLIDQDGIKITATEMTNNSIWGEGIKLLIENNTEKNIGVGCNALIVNDYMISDLFVASVAAGKKANETMYISSNELEAAGISNIGQIEIYFHFYDDDSYDTLFDADCVTIQTSEYANMDIAASDDGQELYNQDGIRIVGKYVDEGSFWGCGVLLFIENKSGKNVGISCDDMSINGFMVSPLFSCTVYDNKMAVSDITIFSSDLEDNGIESVDDIELNFHIYDADSYMTITDTGAIQFSTK